MKVQSFVFLLFIHIERYTILFGVLLLSQAAFTYCIWMWNSRVRNVFPIVYNQNTWCSIPDRNHLGVNVYAIGQASLCCLCIAVLWVQFCSLNKYSYAICAREIGNITGNNI
ncbi:hypothetical protein GDO81_015321 [Engystomops pustulosus]|uniref:Uncharacterized protein n=1 Tax=Engystomops pustulosus TaxID=76066 RepID=A0AAV7AIW3_ENGPU|nr:hypothetical protein GDO81_015321 [Engystomops pustulosus]